LYYICLFAVSNRLVVLQGRLLLRPW
jgi:hypothetical protein